MAHRIPPSDAPQNQPSSLLIQTLDPSSIHLQLQSPLFSSLPAEIRNLIFHFALLSYPDPSPSRAYNPHNCFVRPGYTAPHISTTTLLQTCRRILTEAWALPFTSAEHTLFFTAPARKPRNASDPAHLTTKLLALHNAGVPAWRLVLDHIRIFPQLYNLEPGALLQNTLDIPHFAPKVITICLRHTDWWYWEDDEPLHVCAQWVRDCRLPDSVVCLRMELESLVRKKAQVDDIAAQMRESWCFKRKDGTLLAMDPGEPFTSELWTGTSVWSRQRWTRDEVPQENGQERLELDYYVLTVRWRPLAAHKVEAAHRETAPDLSARNPGPRIFGYRPLPWPPVTRPRNDGIAARDLQNLPPGRLIDHNHEAEHELDDLDDGSDDVLWFGEEIDSVSGDEGGLDLDDEEENGTEDRDPVESEDEGQNVAEHTSFGGAPVIDPEQQW